MKKRIFALFCALAWLLALPAPAETVRGNLEERFGAVTKIEYEGTDYRLRGHLTTILVAGVDDEGDGQAADDYRGGAQADFQLLIVIDSEADTLRTLQINRDTMTAIPVLNVLGKESGTRTAQICLAHAFGSSPEQSAELLVRAVSGYLMDVPVDHYIILDLEGVSAFNDALGGVEVTLEDDFSAFDPAMTQGSTLTLTGGQAQIFVRGRTFVGDQTNVSRIRRQQTYIEAAQEKLTGMLKASPGSINDVYDALKPYITTDMTKGRIANTVFSALRCETLPELEIEGESALGENGFMEFRPDADSRMRAVLEMFFEPA